MGGEEMLASGKKRYKILIDPGHGGQDPGTKGVAADGVTYYEKRIAMAYALDLAGLLAGDDRFDLMVTRTGDYYTSLKQRVDLANDWGAHMFLSCHLNAASASYVRGVEIFRYRWSRQGDLIAKSILAGILGVGLLPQWSSGVKRNESWYVLKRTKMPAVLIEMGFMTNPEDMDILTQLDSQVSLARGVYNGISETVGKLHIRRS
jgi:N-acetylmuramoyl-L-alanine amidase